MTRENRSRENITRDIMQLCSNPIKKTHIMYRANLSYEQVTFYLGRLVDTGYVERRIGEMPRKGEPDVEYALTEKGIALLEKLAVVCDEIMAIYAPEKLAEQIASQSRKNKWE